MTTASKVDTRSRFRAVFIPADGELTVSQLAALASGLENLLALCSFTASKAAPASDWGSTLQIGTSGFGGIAKTGAPKKEPSQEPIVIGPEYSPQRLTMQSQWRVAHISYNSPLEVIFTWLGSGEGAILTTLPTAALMFFAKMIPEFRENLARAKTVEEEEALKRDLIRVKRRYLRERGIGEEAVSKVVEGQLGSSTHAMSQMLSLEPIE